MHGFWQEIPIKLSVPPLYSPFWTHCMQYVPSGIYKGQWRKQQKFERRIRKRNHAFGNERIRVRPPFIISSCTVYISWLFRMSVKCVRNLGRTIGRVSTKHQKDYCNSFSLLKGGKARWSLVFSESPTNEDK